MKRIAIVAGAASLAMMLVMPCMAADGSAPPGTAQPATRAPMTLYPGDAVEMIVAGFAVYSGTWSVDAEGNMQIATLVSVHVGGLDVDDARRAIRDAVWSRVRGEPDITFRDLHRVSVLGEVRTPGLYMVDGTERVTDLIAKAGGTTQSASMKGVRVTRDGGALQKNLKEELKTGRTLREIGLRSGDVLWVPERHPMSDWRNWAIVASTLSSVALALNAIHNN